MYISKLFITESIGSEKQIYCDMDGVLTDFDGRVNAIDPKLSKDENKFVLWKIIENHGTAWWSKMNWMPDGKALWKYIEPYDPIILSACPPGIPRKKMVYDFAKLGKTEWIARELGQKYVQSAQLVLRKEKKNFADEHSLLIDDDIKNYKEFTAAGGTVILHKNTRKTIQQLKRMGI